MNDQQCKKARGGRRIREKKYSKINKNSNEKEQKKDANFSFLTHLKAALVGRIGGWLVRQSRGGGGSSRSNLKNQFRFSVPNLLSRIKSIVGKDQTKDKTDNYFCRAA